jgi:MFS family permease
MFDWYKDLRPNERRTFWGCSFGWSLDAMDVQLYSFVMPALIAAWHLSHADAGLIGTVTLLTSALGGWVAGWLSDRMGRVKLLQLTILWFSFFTFLSGFTNNFEQLLIVRALQGFGFGGEWAAGAVLLGEVVQDKYRGRALGTVHSGWAVGWGMAALLYAFLFQVLPPENAWRWMFWLALLPAAAVIVIRRTIQEPQVYKTQKENRAEKSPGMLGIFQSVYLKRTFFASLLACGAQGGFYAIAIWLPTYLKTSRNLSVLSTGGYLAVVIIGSFLGYVISAYLTDYLGRRKNFLLFSVSSILTILIYMFVPIDNSIMLWLGFPLGFFASGIYSGIGPFFTELFPTAVRGTGVGFCFAIGRAVGAAFPALVGFLSASLGLGAAIGGFTVFAYSLIVIAVLVLPETKGTSLQSVGDATPSESSLSAATVMNER